MRGLRVGIESECFSLLGWGGDELFRLKPEGVHALKRVREAAGRMEGAMHFLRELEMSAGHGEGVGCVVLTRFHIEASIGARSV